MTDTTHIEGPWEIDRSGKYCAPCIRHNGLIVCLLPDNSQGLMREVDRESARARDEKTAGLIAAAPELLAALKGTRRLLVTLLNTSVVAKSSGKGGHDGDGNCWAEIARTGMPDWAARQLLDECNEAIVRAGGSAITESGQADEAD